MKYDGYSASGYGGVSPGVSLCCCGPSGFSICRDSAV